MHYTHLHCYGWVFFIYLKISVLFSFQEFDIFIENKSKWLRNIERKESNMNPGFEGSPQRPMNQKLKQILIFGEGEAKEQLAEKLDNLVYREEFLPYDPKVYVETIFNALTSLDFSDHAVGNADFFNGMEEEEKNYPLWQEIREVVRNKIGLRLCDFYPKKWIAEWKLYRESSQYGNQHIKEIIDVSFKTPLMNQAELLIMEIAKTKANFVIWVSLDSCQGQSMDRTIEGINKGVFDHTLRSLYHHREKIKVPIVFWREEQEVSAPWEQHPKKWERCASVGVSGFKENSITKNILLYGLSDSRNMFMENNNIFIKNVQRWNDKDFYIDTYNNHILQIISQNVKPVIQQSSDDLFAKCLNVLPYKNELPLWKLYYRASESKGKLQLKNILKKFFSDVDKQYEGKTIESFFIKKGCKIGIEMAALDRELTIYFILDKIRMLDVIQKKKIERADSTLISNESFLGSELRYVYRNWKRLEKRVVFIQNNQLVKPPWETVPTIWKQYTPKSFRQKETIVTHGSLKEGDQVQGIRQADPVKLKEDSSFSSFEKMMKKGIARSNQLQSVGSNVQGEVGKGVLTELIKQSEKEQYCLQNYRQQGAGKTNNKSTHYEK